MACDLTKGFSVLRASGAVGRTAFCCTEVVFGSLARAAGAAAKDDAFGSHRSEKVNFDCRFELAFECSTRSCKRLNFFASVF